MIMLNTPQHAARKFLSCRLDELPSPAPLELENRSLVSLAAVDDEPVDEVDDEERSSPLRRLCVPPDRRFPRRWCRRLRELLLDVDDDDAADAAVAGFMKLNRSMFDPVFVVSVELFALFVCWDWAGDDDDDVFIAACWWGRVVDWKCSLFVIGLVVVVVDGTTGVEESSFRA